MLLEPPLHRKISFSLTILKIEYFSLLNCYYEFKSLHTYTMFMITSLILKNKCSSNTFKKFEVFRKVLHSLLKFCFLIILKRFILAQLYFGNFPVCIDYLQSIRVTFGKEESSLQNYCKTINQYNLSFLPMETIEIRIFLF